MAIENEASNIENDDQIQTFLEIIKHHEKDITYEYTVDEMLKMAQENLFPKKPFIFEKKTKSYSPILLLPVFDCDRVFIDKPKTLIFRCKERGHFLNSNG